MTNQSTVPHTEVGLRLTICSEFLLDEQKPIEELYRSWMRRVGGRIIEFAEFEYWYRRFKNNQFDLGYDTSQDENVVFGTPNGAQIDDKLEASNGAKEVNFSKFGRFQNSIVERGRKNYRFNVQNVPRYFQSLMQERTEIIRNIAIEITSDWCFMNFGDTEIKLGRRHKRWTIQYKNKRIPTSKPERSIIDHLWFVLMDPNTKLDSFCLSARGVYGDGSLKFKKLFSMLTAMFDSFQHQIQISHLFFEGFDEDVFLSIVRKLQPGTLTAIEFAVDWSESYEKMEEIVKMDQWKQAKVIESTGVTSLTIDDLLHCERFTLFKSFFTPEDVLRVKEHVSNSTTTTTKATLRVNSLSNLANFEKILESDSVFKYTTPQNVHYEYVIPNSNNVLIGRIHRDEVSQWEEACFTRK
ncbi:unnamed protein product [Caenorhabditis brenneri]